MTIAVYSFAAACLFGRQFQEGHAPLDVKVPVFTVLQVSVKSQQYRLDF